MKLSSFNRDRRSLRYTVAETPILVAVYNFTFKDSQSDVGEVFSDVIIQVHPWKVSNKEDIAVVGQGVQVLLNLCQFVPENIVKKLD